MQSEEAVPFELRLHKSIVWRQKILVLVLDKLSSEDTIIADWVGEELPIEE